MSPLPPSSAACAFPFDNLDSTACCSSQPTSFKITLPFRSSLLTIVAGLLQDIANNFIPYNELGLPLLYSARFVVAFLLHPRLIETPIVALAPTRLSVAILLSGPSHHPSHPISTINNRDSIHTPRPILPTTASAIASAHDNASPFGPLLRLAAVIVASSSTTRPLCLSSR